MRACVRARVHVCVRACVRACTYGLDEFWEEHLPIPVLPVLCLDIRVDMVRCDSTRSLDVYVPTTSSAVTFRQQHFWISNFGQVFCNTHAKRISLAVARKRPAQTSISKNVIVEQPRQFSRKRVGDEIGEHPLLPIRVLGVKTCVRT